jgi:hypothetical protein
MRFLRFVLLLLALTAVLSGCTTSPEKLGMYYSGSVKAEHVHLLVDETWVDTNDTRYSEQEIFASVFEMINEAEEFILLDIFLVNDFGYAEGPGMWPSSDELTERLVAKRNSNPEVEIIFISDPVNTVYSSYESPHFNAMEEAGIKVVWTDLDKMRDSNPGYSKLWRIFVKPFGVGPGRTFKNPMGDGRVSMRSLLKLVNFKANHRKVIATDKSILLTSANPHSASSAHWNVALRVDGAGMEMVCEAESAILEFSGEERFEPYTGGAIAERPGGEASAAPYDVELLTEQRIKDKVLDLLEHAEPGARIDLCMFYFSEKTVVKAFADAKKRGCDVRVILDPSKDAFGLEKNGVPNRQSGAKLVKAGVPLRWTETHGEQCHVKMLYVEHPDKTATLLLGSCNYTRRNMNNFNCEANLAVRASVDDANMKRAREVFDRWWSNPGGRIYTTEYETYEDRSKWRAFMAWWQERTGMGTF